MRNEEMFLRFEFLLPFLFPSSDLGLRIQIRDGGGHCLHQTPAQSASLERNAQLGAFRSHCEVTLLVDRGMSSNLGSHWAGSSCKPAWSYQRKPLTAEGTGPFLSLWNFYRQRRKELENTYTKELMVVEPTSLSSITTSVEWLPVKLY